MALFVLIKCIYWLKDYQLFFSANSIVYNNEVKLSWWRMLVFFLFNGKSGALSLVFLISGVLTSGYALFFEKYLRVTFLLLWFIANNIINAVFCSLSGGDYLLIHLLFFSVFFSSKTENKNTFWGNADKAIHNAGVIAIMIQVCLVYFLSGYAKLSDTDWLNGNAITDSLRVHDYSLPLFYNGGFTILGTISTYFVIAYQLLFPVLVFLKKIKKWFLLLGILQHLFIVFVLGLPSFGFIMIVAYAIFYAPFSQTKNS